jgi:hypothetical protein
MNRRRLFSSARGSTHMTNHPTFRTKMISFRVSEAEFEALKSHFRDHGATSVSDLARSALEQVITGVFSPELDRKFKEIESRLSALEERLGPAGLR